GHEADEAWQGVRDFIENVSQRTFRKLAMFIGKNGEGKTGAINNQEQPKSDGTRVGGEDAEAVKPHLEALQSMGASVAEGSASATGVFICGYLSEDEARRGQRSGGLLRAGSRAGGTGTNYAAITVMPAHAFNHIAVRLASEEEIQQECQDQIALLRNAPADDPDIDDNIDDTERVQAAEDFLCAATGQTIDDIRSKLEEWDSDTVQAAGSEIKVPVKLERVHAELAQQLATEVLNVVDGLAEELRAGKVRRLVLAGPVEYLRNSLQGILQCNHKNKGLALSKDTDAVTVYSVGWRHEFVSWVDTPGCDDGDTVNEDVTVKVIEDVDCVVMLTSRDLQGCKSLQRHYLLKENDGKGILKRLLRAEVERLQDDAQPFHFMYVINAEKDLAGKEGSADPEGRFQILQDPEVSRDFAEAKARTQKELFRLLVYENRKEGMNLPEEKLQEIADRIPVIVIYGDTHRSLMELKRWVSHRDLALTGMPALRDAIEQTVYPAFLAAEKTLRKSLRAARKPRAGNNPEGPPASAASGSTLSRLAKCDPAELKAEIDTMVKHTRGRRDDIMSKVQEGCNRAINFWLQNSLRPRINECLQKQDAYYAKNEHSFSTKLKTARAVQTNHRLTKGIISKGPYVAPQPVRTGGTVIEGRQQRGKQKKITKRKLHDFVCPEHELADGARIKFTEMPPSEETAAFKASLESNLLTDFVQPMERLVQEFRDHLCEGRDPGSSNIPHWESYFDGKRRKSIESELKQMVASFLSVQPAKQTFGTVFRKFLHQAMWESIDEHICEPALHPPQCPESDAAHLRYMKGCIKDGLQPAAEGAMEKAEEALRTFCRERRRMLDLAMEAMLYKAVNGFITFVRHARKGKGKMGGSSHQDTAEQVEQQIKLCNYVLEQLQGCGDHADDADDDDAADDADDADDDSAADDDGAGVDGDDSLDRPSASPPSEVQSLGTASLHAHPQRLDPDAERGGPPAPPEAAVSPGQCLKQGLRELEWEGYALLEKMYEASLRHAGPEEDAVQEHILVHEASCFPKDIDSREGVQAESDYSGEVKLQNGRYVRHGFGVFEKFEWRIENGEEIQRYPAKSIYAYIGQFEDGKEHGHGVTLYMKDARGTPASITIGEGFGKRRGAGDLCLWLIGDYAIEEREDAPQKGVESLLYWDEQDKELYLPVRRCQAKLKKFYASDGLKVHTEFEDRRRSDEEWAKAGTAVVKAISAARVANQKRKEASVDGLKGISVYEDCAFYPGSHVRIVNHRELSGECATVKSAREWEAEVLVESSGKIVALPTGFFESTEVLGLHSAAGKCYRKCTCPDSGSQDHHGDGGADASVGCTTHRVRSFMSDRKTLVDAGWTVQTLKAYESGNGNHYSYTSPDGTKFTNRRGAMDHHTANASQLQPTPANQPANSSPANASQRQLTPANASQLQPRQPTPANSSQPPS
ncbi:hypothetical protein CYMTET_48833, partial [Cymbomonas tetramitiformis]